MGKRKEVSWCCSILPFLSSLLSWETPPAQRSLAITVKNVTALRRVQMGRDSGDQSDGTQMLSTEGPHAVEVTDGVGGLPLFSSGFTATMGVLVGWFLQCQLQIYNRKVLILRITVG